MLEKMLVNIKINDIIVKKAYERLSFYFMVTGIS